MKEQARWTKSPIANDLKTSIIRSDTGIRREVGKCVPILSNRLSATEVSGSEVASSVKARNHNETSKGGGSKSVESGVRSRNVGGSSS